MTKLIEMPRSPSAGARLAQHEGVGVSPEKLEECGEVLSVADVGRVLPLSEKVIREYCATGKLPGVKIGSRWVIPKCRLIEALGMAGEVA